MLKFKPLAWLLISLLVIFLDQLSKYALIRYLNTSQYALLPHVNLILVHNSGAAFSLLHSSGGWQRWLFIAIAFIASVFFIVWLMKTPKERYIQRLAITLILGGAMANLIDRVRLGYVIDFIDFYIGQWHFATFNLADSAITLGAILLVLTAFRNKQG